MPPDTSDARPPLLPVAARDRFVAELHTLQQPPPPGIGTLIAFLIAGLLCLSLVAIPLAIGIVIGWYRRRRESRLNLQFATAFAARATPCVVYPLMVNTLLVKGDTTDPAPGLVLLSLDPRVTMMDMVRIAARFSSRGDDIDTNLFGPSWSDDARAFATAVMDDEPYVHQRRRPLPPEMTDGREIYACDLMIHPHFFAAGSLGQDTVMLAALAEPGPAGRILHLPWWHVQGIPAPTLAHRQASAMMAFAFEHLYKRFPATAPPAQPPS